MEPPPAETPVPPAALPPLPEGDPAVAPPVPVGFTPPLPVAAAPPLPGEPLLAPPEPDTAPPLPGLPRPPLPVVVPPLPEAGRFSLEVQPTRMVEQNVMTAAGLENFTNAKLHPLHDLVKVAVRSPTRVGPGDARRWPRYLGTAVAGAGMSPSSQMPAPQKACWTQVGSWDIASVQTVAAQRFLRSFS